MRNRHVERWLEDQRSTWRYWEPRLRLDTELTPLRIALAYSILGMGALVVSDVIFVRYLWEPLLSRVQAIKGGAEVVLTAGLILVLTARRETQLQRSIDRLDRQHEQLQVLHRVLRHNLRNDLNVIQGYTKRIQERQETDRFDPECAKITKTIERMTRYTEQAARIKRLTEGDGAERTYDLAETIPRIIEDDPVVTGDVEISVSIPSSATVVANHTFESALKEVITNAIQHNRSESPRVSIEVGSADSSRHEVEIEISDNGPGIPAAELETLRTGREDPVVHLSGLGLWFVTWTIRQSGGSLQFEGNEQGGTTVCIQLPETPAEDGRRPSLFASFRDA